MQNANNHRHAHNLLLQYVLTQDVIYNVARLHVNVELLHLQESQSWLSHLPTGVAPGHIGHLLCCNPKR